MSGDSNLAWDMLTPQQWTTLVTAALAKGDLKAIPGILALCAVHGHPEHAEVWKVEEVMDAIEGSDPTTWERLRDALAGSDADTTYTQSTDPGCGCSTNPARARYADGDPAGCYCTCSDDAREGCEHEPDEPQPTDLEVK